MLNYITSYLDKSVQTTPGQAGNLFWALVFVGVVQSLERKTPLVSIRSWRKCPINALPAGSSPTTVSG